MFKLVLEKAEEPEIKLPISVGSSKKQESSRKTCFCFINCAKGFDCMDHSKLWKILKEMGTPDHLTCLLRNLYVGRTGHGTTDWFQIRKGVCQGCILSPCLFNLYADYIMRNTGLEEAQAGIKIAGKISITSRGRGKDGGGIGREDHFLPHKFLKRTFQRWANFTKQLL